MLKRLADAERDGDRVYAVIKGIGSASDGRSLGLTAPRPEGQRRALERAYRSARRLARPTSAWSRRTAPARWSATAPSWRTLTDVFTEAGARPGQCALGSVKSQIGHTKCAAGLAGLIKAALALHTGDHAADAARSPRRTRPGTSRDEPVLLRARRASRGSRRPRIAGVSAFGFGGTNFHAVLTAHEPTPTPRHGLDEWPAELFTFRSASDIEQLAASESTARSSMLDRSSARLRDLPALSVSLRNDQRDEPVRAAIVAVRPWTSWRSLLRQGARR